jgi:CRP-like cAMP-binding protein
MVGAGNSVFADSSGKDHNRAVLQPARREGIAGHGRAQTGADQTESPFLLRRFSGVWQRHANLATTTTYAKGSSIYLQGESSVRFFHLLIGRVRIYTLRPDGTQVLLSIAEPGSMFGESSSFAGLPYYASATAVMRSTVNAFPSSALHAVMDRDPEGRAEIVRQLVYKQRQLGMQLAVRDQKAWVRVARLLTHLIEAYGEPAANGAIRIKVQLSMQELASIVGLTRVTMSREISAQVRRGVLVKDKWEIIVLKPEALRVDSDFH